MKPFSQDALIPGRSRWFFLSALLLAPLSVVGDGSPAVTFEQNVRPILKANCFDCHGEGEKLKGGLDLRLRRLILQGGESGPAIVPGDPSASRLLKLVMAGEMPKREKKLSAIEIGVLRDWIAAGAVTAREEPVQLAKGMTITDEERAFWSFQPIRRPLVPRVQMAFRVRTPVDAFLVAGLEKRGLFFSPEAEKRTLLRRLSMDLIGLPPSPAEVTRFLADRSPESYDRAVEELLASPHYGERWGRHWLDVAGYADSDGYNDTDAPREFAYKYRDYVIRSFNADKPFDRFIEEQLAGDELAAAQDRDLRPGQIEQLVATGFLRMAADGTAQGGVDQDVARNQVMSDVLKIVSSSLLGLTVGCAQCHDHRYDPIPQADYYRLRAVFEPAYDWKNWRTPPQRLRSLATEADRKKTAEIEAEAQKISAEKERKQAEFIAAALEKHLQDKFPEALRAPLRLAYQTPDSKRTAEQKKLLADHPSVNINSGVLYQYNAKAADELKAMDARIAAVRAGKPREDFIQCLTEIPGSLPATFRFHRGDPRQPRDRIEPGGLSVVSPPNRRLEIAMKDGQRPTSGRRLALARWLMGRENPLTARVLVNRFWMHHFGRGLVGTLADFGTTGERPSHPELLDWLASEFRDSGWSLKHLHRLLVRSTAYRQSSLAGPPGGTGDLDPENRWYGRWPVRRLDAEALRDSILAVAGSMDSAMFGPPVPVRENAVGQVVVGVDKKEGDNKVPVEVPIGGEEFRRSVYVQVRRSMPLALLNSFDAPVMEVNCERRPTSTVATQALMLMNSDFILQQAVRFARRLQTEAGPAVEHEIVRAWELALGRPPSEREVREATQFLRAQAEEWMRSRPSGAPATGKGPEPKKEGELQALTSLCQALLSGNEFLYVD